MLIGELTKKKKHFFFGRVVRREKDGCLVAHTLDLSDVLMIVGVILPSAFSDLAEERVALRSVAYSIFRRLAYAATLKHPPPGRIFVE